MEIASHQGRENQENYVFLIYNTVTCIGFTLQVRKSNIQLKAITHGLSIFSIGGHDMQKRHNDHTKKLGTFLLLGFAAFLTLMVLVNVSVFYKSLTEALDILESSIKEKLYATAQAASLMIDVGEHEKVHELKDYQTPQVNITLDKLRNLAKRANMTYIYTMRKEKGKMYFVLDTDEEEAPGVDTLYEDYPRVADKILSGESQVEYENVSDKWGNYITILVPVKDPEGNVVAALAADYSDTHVAELKRSMYRNIMFQLAIVFVLFGLLFIVLRDILKKNMILTEKMKRSEEIHRLAIAGIQEAVFEYSTLDKSIYVNHIFGAMVGIPTLAENMGLFRFLSLFNQTMSNELKLTIERMEQGLETSFSMEILTDTPRVTWVLIRGTASINNQNKTICINGAISDISERKMLEDTINQMAYFDALTSLPNRTYLLEQLQKYMSQEEDPFFALLFIDLDNFKLVTDSAGHEAGDRVLQTVAAYLMGMTDLNMAESDAVSAPINIAARLGGDEFVIVIPTDKKYSQLENFTERLLGEFDNLVICPEKDTYHVTMSVGIALYPEHAQDLTQLLQNADTAMYHAKRKGKNTSCIFEPDMLL